MSTPQNVQAGFDKDWVYLGYVMTTGKRGAVPAVRLLLSPGFSVSSPERFWVLLLGGEAFSKPEGHWLMPELESEPLVL